MTPSERLNQIAEAMFMGSACHSLDPTGCFCTTCQHVADLRSIAAEIDKAPQCGVPVEVADAVFNSLSELLVDHDDDCKCSRCRAHDAYRSARDAAKGAR